MKALLKETIDQPDSRLFVCGLAFDFCVLDTAINAACTLGSGMRNSEGTKKPVFIVHEATRAAHIPGVGAYGSGFLSDPKEIAGKLLHHSVSMIDVN